MLTDVFLFARTITRYKADKYVPGPEEAEQLIFDAITKITTAKQRASSDRICAVLLRSHGLNESEVMLRITMMLATNKIENKATNGLESLKIVDSSFQSVKKVGKERKLSKEEDKQAECRQGLKAVADAESNVMKNKVMNGIGNMEKDEPFENTENTENN